MLLGFCRFNYFYWFDFFSFFPCCPFWFQWSYPYTSTDSVSSISGIFPQPAHPPLHPLPIRRFSPTFALCICLCVTSVLAFVLDIGLVLYFYSLGHTLAPNLVIFLALALSTSSSCVPFDLPHDLGIAIAPFVFLS